jgi:hypothetical protein
MGEGEEDDEEGYDELKSGASPTTGSPPVGSQGAMEYSNPKTMNWSQSAPYSARNNARSPANAGAQDEPENLPGGGMPQTGGRMTPFKHITGDRRRTYLGSDNQIKTLVIPQVTVDRLSQGISDKQGESLNAYDARIRNACTAAARQGRQGWFKSPKKMATDSRQPGKPMNNTLDIDFLMHLGESLRTTGGDYGIIL